MTRPERSAPDALRRFDHGSLGFSLARHAVLMLMSGRGTPRSLRHMNGYGSHTFSWVNAGGEKFWVKYHFKSDQGVETLTQEEANRLAGEDADFHRRDLHDAIEAGRPALVASASCKACSLSRSNSAAPSSRHGNARRSMRWSIALRDIEPAVPP